jgi:aspartate kinase
MTVLSIRSNRKNLSHGFLAGIFATLDKRRLAVDLISTSEVHVSMAVHTGTSARLAAVAAVGRELENLGSVEVIRGMTILAVVGRHLKNMVGIAGRMFHTLAESGVNIEMISQGEFLKNGER